MSIGITLVMACGGDDDVDDNQFRTDVLDCESAVAHLKSCCGASFDPQQVTCHHLYAEDPGCGTSRVVRDDPDLSEDDSDCIRAKECSSIAKNDICARVARRGLSLSLGTAVPLDGGGDSITAPVCP